MLVFLELLVLQKFHSVLFFCSFLKGKKFSLVTTFFPVFSSNASLASLAILPPFSPAFAFSCNRFASSVSAIYLVESSASAVKLVLPHSYDHKGSAISGPLILCV